MKRLHSLLVVVLLLHGYLQAQEPEKVISGKKETRPSLFTSLPDSFDVDKSQLQKIFSANVNDQVSLQLSKQFKIEGTIVGKNQHTPGSLSINVRLSNYKNALLNITLRLMADNSTRMQGRILHPRYNDILTIDKDKDRYFIKKSSSQLYMPE
jgi:hypothetical protein